MECLHGQTCFKICKQTRNKKYEMKISYIHTELEAWT